jgi:hypothetical protein
MAAEDESQQELTLVSLPLDSIPMVVFNASPVAAADQGNAVQVIAAEAAASYRGNQMTTTMTMHHEIDAPSSAAARSPQEEEREAVRVPERRSRRFLQKVSVGLPFLLSAMVLYIYYIYVVHVCSKRRPFPL